MNKNDFLKNIAEKAYDVGFGAKKHYATYDILSTVPGVISFLSIAVGVISLVVESLKSNYVSVSVIILGIVGIYVSSFSSEKEIYANCGKDLTILFNKLKNLYFKVKSTNENFDYDQFSEEFNKINDEFYTISNSKQILFSGWFAHYKFFWEHQIDWIEEIRPFKLFRDKIPLSFTSTIVIIVLLIVYFKL